ncbi:MAG: FAD-dependent oxidoreductase [Acidimicrobiia bacterium]
MTERSTSTTTDVVVLGSGGAGLTAAVTAASTGAEVVVLERSPQLGGTTSVSGGMVWVPQNNHMSELGIVDSRDEALAYLRACTAGHVAEELLEAYVDTAPAMITFLEANTPARFRAVRRPDYRPEWPGGKPGGRTLDNLPFDASMLDGIPVRPRRSAIPFTHDELVATKLARRANEIDWEAVRARERAGVVTMGAALTASLVAGCLQHGVRFETGVRAVDLVVDDADRISGVVTKADDGCVSRHLARRGVVIATGGFEWSAELRQAFLGRPLDVPISPPWNVGDALRLGQRARAGLGNMTEAWWVPSYLVPGETYEGQPLGRHLSSDLSLPGSIMVNGAGARFVNESVNYNDLSAAFAIRDSEGTGLANLPCWMVFDSDYQQRYSVAGTPAAADPPDWWYSGESWTELAQRLGVDANALVATIERFNADARNGADSAFGRGASAHDRFYGDAAFTPNPCLAPLESPPFYAIEVRPGAFGTKGGLKIDAHARVIDVDNKPVPGLFAAGNASAGMTGPGYPGAGATLGSALTFGYLAGCQCR